MRERKLATCDAETDPFLHRRIPVPFIWGYYDGKQFQTFTSTAAFIDFIKGKRIVLYAHNGGKFDFMFFIPFLLAAGLGEGKMQVINGRIVSMMIGVCELRDSFAAMPEALKNIQKKEIEIWKLESTVRAEHEAEILDYLYHDCFYLYNLMDTYRNTVGTKTTIASNALNFCQRKLKINAGKTNHRFDHEFRRWYFGGRTECFQPGTHERISILDIKSAYPRAMMDEHATGGLVDFHVASKIPDGMTRDELQRAFLKVTCTARGCFAIRPEKGSDGLLFPHEFNQYFCTGWEYVAALELGLISDVHVDLVQWSDKKIHFRPYVEHWFKYKQEHDKRNADGELLTPIERTIGKIMLNALYGKFAQDPSRYSDYRIVAAGTRICRKFLPSKEGGKLCRDCGKFEIDHGWEWCVEFDNLEIHYRPCLWKFQQNPSQPWESKKLYKNVATAASITGWTRAYLLRAIHSVGADNVIYCDTDSLICKSSSDFSTLNISDELGGWTIEDANAPVGHFAGKKLYAIQTSKPHKQKIASKGSKLTFADVKEIAQGGTVTWRSPAPSFNIITGRTPYAKTATGEPDLDRLFVVREIRATNADQRKKERLEREKLLTDIIGMF